MPIYKIMKGKTVASTSAEDQIYKIFPNDLNSQYTVFGGLVMGLIDRIAVVVAERHAEKVCATASVDALNFLSPAKLGEILILKASVNRAWNASMEIGVRVEAENFQTKEKRHVVSAYLTFVALDDQGKPTKVPPVITETSLEKRRFEEAGLRREKRLSMHEQVKTLRARASS